MASYHSKWVRSIENISTHNSPPLDDAISNVPIKRRNADFIQDVLSILFCDTLGAIHNRPITDHFFFGNGNVTSRIPIQKGVSLTLA